MVISRPQQLLDARNANAENGDGYHEGLRRMPAVRYPDREHRSRDLPLAADPLHKHLYGLSTDLDVQGDLGLQCGPRLFEGLYPLEEVHQSPLSKESGYSINKQLGLTCIPKGSLGSRVQYLQSGPGGKYDSQNEVLAGSPREDKKYVETAPDKYDYRLSGILGSTAPRVRGKRVHLPIQKTSPATSERSLEIPFQDSAVTLCGSIAANGVYKIQESNFGRDYTFIRMVGEGGFGRIELHKHDKTGKLLVLKKTRMALEYTDGIPAEAYILRDILGKTHERLPRLHHFNVSLAESHYWMDYCDSGDLADLAAYFLRKDRNVPEGFIWHVHSQLSAATAYLHTGLLDRTHPELPPPANWQPVVHRDIKPDNIFLKLVPGNIYPDIVLGDFGLATTNQFTGTPGKILGTPTWQPPQIPFHTPFSDVWAAGAVIHQLALTYPPLLRKPSNDLPMRSHLAGDDGGMVE
ncbi:MAG: hypothetical protein Q9170_004787 [Blastenia crenularia]